MRDGLIGQTIGGCRILERIGRGGMARVYKAYQPSLERYVAVKVLPGHFAEEPGFTQRFRREARAVAKLEHPHILAVHDFGQEGELSYLVMRYVEAGTLKDLLGAPLGLWRVADLISQVGEALDHAHEQGVVHRDVKPSNVLLDRGEWVLLSDFGLARMMEASQQLTATGVGMGTPDYMSPEQGMGKRVDRRSDVYSLGVVLYEMLTGRVPYEAETPMAVVFKHINDPLPLPRDLNPGLPEAVQRVVLKALAKAPEDRYQSAGGLAAALRGAVRGVEAASTLAVPPVVGLEATIPGAGVEPAEGIPGRRWSWRVVGALMLVGVVVAALWLLARQAPLRVQIVGGRVEVVQPTATPGESRAAIVPEGASREQPKTASAKVAVTAIYGSPTAPRVVFTTNRDNNQEIYAMRADGSGQINLTNDLGSDREPAWSPDGSRIAFTSDRDGNPEIYVMRADGSDPARLTDHPGIDASPAWSPGGGQIAFISDRSGRLELHLMNPDGSGVRQVTQNGAREFAWSPDGSRIAYRSYTTREFYLVGEDGSGLLQLTESTEAYGPPAWSPEGDRIALSSYHESFFGSVYLVNGDGSGFQRVSPEITGGQFAWSPDGTQMVISGSNPNALYVVDLATGETADVYDGRTRKPVWLPDGETIGFYSPDDIYMVKTGGRALPVNLTNNPGFESDLAWWWPVFREDFTDRLEEGWAWTNEDRSAWSLTSDGQLMILAGDAMLLSTENGQRNVLLRDAPAGDFEITARVSAQPSVDFQQAAILIYQDDDNFIAINRGFCSTCVGSGIYVDNEIEGGFLHEGREIYWIPMDAGEVYLRLRRQGDTYTPSYRLPGEAWIELPPLERVLQPVKVGLGATNADVSGLVGDLVASFDFFTLREID